jgi:hypothetical protein
MSVKYFVEATCNECGKSVTADFVPPEWVTSIVGINVHFCGGDCMNKALKRIEDANIMVFGKVLTDKERLALAKSVPIK